MESLTSSAIRASVPTKVLDSFWVWAESFSKPFTGGARSGKWMLFYEKSLLDEKWLVVKDMVERDQLGGLAKCSTARTNPNATSSATGVIIVYTPDYLDQEDVYRVATVLHEKMDYKKPMFYKTDEQTLAGVYKSNGSQKNHLYRFPL
ncbi:hypothetical protein BGW38_007106 [Lunasporangiospora selenospora]|uniref:Uncharacterized protein n=1 Tax=Lunasporangiospora selenospora TaxID=979761 RepID=A0A9P6KGY5_9FUNG|nr:hypothetical protein BGW38_007106 [Lunasporangiospora selenospora]